MGRYKRHLFSGEHVPSATLRQRRMRDRQRKAELIASSIFRTKFQDDVKCCKRSPISTAGEHQRTTSEGMALQNVNASLLTPCPDSTIAVDAGGSVETGREQSDPSGNYVALCDNESDLHLTQPSNDMTFTTIPGTSVHEKLDADTEKNDLTSGQDAAFHETMPTLCSHTECTADDVMLMCLSLGFRHNLSWVAIVDIMKMINAIYGTKKVSATKYKLMQRLFERDDFNVDYHYYCEKCCVYVSQVDSSKGDVVCNFCKALVSDPKKATYFASLPFEPQVKKLLEDDGMGEMALTYRFSRARVQEGNLEDIYDGSEYRKHSRPGGILSVAENLSYTFFTDGVAVGKTKKSMWPIYATINELSPRERAKHVLLVGLYYGGKDPNQRMFMAPFVKEANKLSTEGLTWNHRGRTVRSRLVPLLCVTDSVARCQVLNMQTFTAHYGCTFCEQKTTRTVKRLKFTLPEERVVERTLETYKDYLVQAHARQDEAQESKRQYRGVKGPSSLGSLLHFNLCSGFSVDYMHNILLGVTKTYFELALDCSKSKFWNVPENERFAMEDVQSAIDKRLKMIKPPTAISRTPRTIKDCGNWKAHEWRTFLLFYSIPCLKGLLHDKYLVHFSLLSEGCHLLLQKSVSREDIEEAHELFQKYTYYYQKYFGPEHMYYNIHLLSHVAKGALRFGGLWTHNSFIYESYNRQLLQLCKNPFRVVKEVSRKYLVMRALPRLLDSFASTENTLFYCEDVLERKLVRFKRCDSCILLGASKSFKLLDDEIAFLCNAGFAPNECLFYDRMLYKGMRFTTEGYSIDKKNNDAVFYTAKGEMYKVLAVFTPSNSVTNILARQIIISDSGILIGAGKNVKYIGAVLQFGNLRIVKSEEICGQCIWIDTVCGVFVCKMPYGCYGD